MKLERATSKKRREQVAETSVIWDSWNPENNALAYTNHRFTLFYPNPKTSST